MNAKFSYGGQAVIEGVMVRGRRFAALAVRRPTGAIALHTRALGSLSTSRLRRVPLLRGVLVLAETLVLGMRALTFSANVALEEERQELTSWAMAAVMGVSFALGIGLFFVLPLFAVQVLDGWVASDLVSNLLEGGLRLIIFVGYILLIGRMSEVRRVFAYHGAEHMAIHAHEAGDPLEVAAVRRHPTAHPRCGTAFLLVVMVVAILVFSLLGRPALVLQVASRIFLLPLIAGVSYEIIRLSGRYPRNLIVRLLLSPSLALQALTTRQPDDGQIEVAISAVKGALAADEGPEEGQPDQGWVERPLEGLAPRLEEGPA